MGLSWKEAQAYHRTHQALESELLLDAMRDAPEVELIRWIDAVLALPAERQAEILSRHSRVIRVLFERTASIQGVL